MALLVCVCWNVTAGSELMDVENRRREAGVVGAWRAVGLLHHHHKAGFHSMRCVIFLIGSF